MTHWTEVASYPVPDVLDTWARPQYDELSGLSHEQLVAVAWSQIQANKDMQWAALNLAQDLSCEFEMCDYQLVKPEHRHGESQRRQNRGLGYMRQAYALSGINHGEVPSDCD